jgi:hypothetical protein
MCHHHDTHWRARTDDEQSDDEAAADEQPSFLEDEPADDVELLTDGGDDGTED